MTTPIFKVYQLTTADAERIQSSVNEPHLHDFEQLIVGNERLLEHFIDFKSQTIDAPFISFVTKGKVHRLRPLLKEGKCDIWIIRFRTEFIPEDTFQPYSSFHEDDNIGMERTACVDWLDVLCGMMHDEYSQEAPDLAVVRQLLSTLFIMIELERRKLNKGNDESKKVNRSIFCNFHGLQEEHYKESEGVSSYAEKLFMTPRNLNLICLTILQ